MKIAILGSYFYPQVFGIEKVMYNHAKHLALRGHTVHVITSNLRFPKGRFKDLPSQEEREGFLIHRLPVLIRAPVRPFHYPSNGGLVIPGLKTLIETLQPDIVHAHNIGAPAWANAAAKYGVQYKKCFFYSPHFHPDRLKFNRIRKIIYFHLNKLPIATAKRILHLTKIDFDLFLEDFPNAAINRFSVLHNGVDPPRFKRQVQLLDKPINILFVGRVDDARKGFEFLVEAMRSVWAACTQKAMLTVVGEILPNTRDRLIQEFGERVRVLGAVSEETLEREYAEADIFVMPSLYEGFGMPFIEAMRYGVPVIGTAVGGIPEVVTEETGILVPAKNPGALSNAIMKLLEYPDLRLSIGTAGLKRAKNFYWERIVEELENYYLSSCE